MQLDSVTLTLTKMHNGRLIDNQPDKQTGKEISRRDLRHKVLHEQKTDSWDKRQIRLVRFTAGRDK